MTDRIHDVVLVGDADAATELLTAGIHDFMLLDSGVVSSRFDDDTWTLTGEDGRICRGRTVITGDSPLAPFVPDLLGRRDFRGTTMHAAMPSNFFDPAGRRVAVIGADSAAGALIDRFAESGAAVAVFPLAPRRPVQRLRRTLRLPRRRRVEVIASPLQEVTAAGIRTADGVHHDVDAIVYGTGLAVRAGLPPETLLGAHGVSIHQDWVDGAEPYFGVAMHGFPNYFTVGEPDVGSAMRYVVDCLYRVGRHSRIEVRRSAQGFFNDRVHLRRPTWQLDAAAFDVSSSEDVHGDRYDGPATLATAEYTQQVRVLLAGRIEPFDGQYHWQGTVFGPIPEALTQARSVTVTVGERSAPARITERTPQGTHSIAGAGDPPFRLADVELSAAGALGSGA